MRIFRNAFTHKYALANYLFAHNIRRMNAIQNIRKNFFKLTQVEFSAVAGVAQATVSRWEKHDVAPSLDEMMRIRRAAKERHLPWDDRLFFEVPEAAE